jgi:hypothetical protein
MDFLRNILSVITDFILAIPMPWRAGLFFFIFAFLGYQVLRRLLVLLLLPEYWITSLMRRLKLHPLPGTLFFDDVIGWLIKTSRWTVWIALLVAIIGVVAWYQRPYIESPTIARYVEKSFDWWYSFEDTITSSR